MMVRVVTKQEDEVYTGRKLYTACGYRDDVL